jgi:leader peptidase (prepilin peptidase)/N-methyltransferase
MEYVLIAILGLCVGSFLNVVRVRLPAILFADAKLSLAWPASFCVNCTHKLAWWHNVPLLSFCLLRGRCGYCKQKISWHYPALEAATMLASVCVFWRYQEAPYLVLALALLFTWGLLVQSWIDGEHLYLLDEITLPGIWLGLAANSIACFVELHAAVWGAIFGYGSLYSIYWVYRLLTGKEGMGAGDFKLLACIGAWLGWQAVAGTILLASSSGALLGLWLLWTKRMRADTPLPFGPFLALAAWLQLLYPQLLRVAL